MLRGICVFSLMSGLAASARAQVFDGSEFRVNATTAFDQMEAAVAADASGRFVVVWMSDNHDGSSRGIFGRRFSASGTCPTSSSKTGSSRHSVRTELPSRSGTPYVSLPRSSARG